MTSSRIHDLAVELGVPSEHLLKLLAESGIHVRSHMSALDAGQVALVRARWEREKRKKDEPEPKKSRRRAAPGATTAAQAAAPADTPAPKRAPKTPKVVKPVEEPEASWPRRRRRTAAEVAAKEAVAEEERQREAAALAMVEATLKVDPPEPKPSLEERAAALFVEPPPASAMEEASSEPGTAQAAFEAPPAPRGPRAEPFIPPRVQRPAPARLRPVASAAPGTAAPPRPIASAAPGESAEDRRARDKKKRKKGGKRSQVDVEAVQANINRTLASIASGPGKKGVRRRDDEPSFRKLEEQRQAEEREREKTLVRVNEFITVSELAEILKITPTQIVTFCFKELGMMVTVNQRLDFDQIELIAGEFGFKAEREAGYASGSGPAEEVEKDENLAPRPPVVTVMGHVDHGKTSLLDYIRKANVVAGEAGGITQHIGAYHITRPDGKRITFLDTPGHEAFTAMRARGAQITDLVVLVVAADDQVMPQTVEAISHAKNAGVPLVVAINKVDLPGANPQKVKQDLLQHGVVLEDFGGQTLSVAVSAKTGAGIEDLLEKVLLQAEVLDLKANPDRLAKGTVVESNLDPGKGPVATVLIQNGTLHVGEDFICGNLAGRVRALFDERGERVQAAGPSVPIQVLGLEGIPHAGDTFNVVSNAQEARDLAQKRQRLDREASHRRQGRGVSLEDLSRAVGEGKVQTLNIIIKADQGGPAEALADAFAQLSTPEVKVEVIHRGVGAIGRGDVNLAKASGAIIIGFHVRPDADARAMADREKVDIRTYRIIYEAVEDVRSALEGLLAPEQKETVLGEAQVMQVFKITGVGAIAGCQVRSGVIRRGARIRVVRDAVEVYAANISSLKRFKEDVREVKEGFECGIGVENFNDIKVGDVLEAFKVEEVARSLEPAGVVKDS
ncbi:MAG: translation initiation factor IF-2 [Gemmatimonadetes bacterium]|nr:translation initiation factor IF-2 [Gemmatimonadota bacterium]